MQHRFLNLSLAPEKNMIDYKFFTLSNGLRLVVHPDKSTPLATLNVLYDVGSRDEDPERTGFAHLFEHLMFGGSKHIPSYDAPLQKVGGENNAFTSPDITNYYITLPAENLETGFWLESDRMLSLDFSEKVLDVQRKVVIEEFKQRYLNQPYGDVWLHLRPLAYQIHPYRWATIGKEIKHIEEASLNDVKAFFAKHYTPNNAVVCVAGNVEPEAVLAMTEKWFGEIPAGVRYERDLPREQLQQSPGKLTIESNVPVDALYKTFHMPGRLEEGYHTADLISDILGRGKSSRLYKKMVQEDEIFNDINAYVTGSVDPGLMVIQGKLNEGVSLQEADTALMTEVARLQQEMIQKEELAKVKNQAEATLAFSEVDLLSRTMNLAFATLLGNPELINQEADMINAVQADDIYQMAQTMLSENNTSTLYYKSIL